ncbi:deoxyribose-phosphate aldolase [Grosmannia clavigera kw1407]|uniref:Deoxyribose-phosphate aldolase n=1 Tax=Grosmannia clavigera (strain kw1407 / UAMH 11150) TaxID=655863 RepID=F0XK70_GROCL|nr:deoxyribose-phosphate aldolase [Grosmannia clavigera kw1407]EFX01995.1 deoxyribose-phosphate aldolase [Grosmannia clavigera kw1407]
MHNHSDSTQRRKVEASESQAMAFNPSTRFQATGGREWTVSVAIPTSILSDCTTSEQRINAPSRVARALAAFSIDELVIYDDSPMESRPKAVDHDGYTGDTDPSHYLFHLLSYIEAPPFMRKALFPLHPNLRLQGLFPNLEMPHHPHRDEHLPYMEGLTVAGKPDAGHKTLVELGLRKPVSIKEEIPVKTRVTLRFPRESFEDGEAVDPAAPRTEAGYYWGYQLRQCSSLSAVFTESAYENGYDVSIGTSERGLPTSQVFPRATTGTLDFQHLIVVLGGPRGLEYAAMNDPDLAGVGITKANVRETFDHWVNVLPNQGTRNIRTDEAVFIALMDLRRLWSDA